jgi:hypothetical protein
MTHDPLCPTIGYSFEFYILKTCPFCPLIAKVRADERHRFDDDGADRDIREGTIREAAGEAALALLAMDGVEFTPEQHNSIIDAILALQEKP